MVSKSGEKGYKLEELLRAYFIRAGVYAVRGVPFQLHGDDLTDVDIWLYERPTGSSRRTQIVDAKSKTKPKAIERLFWTKGLAELLRVDGAYIATTDTRALLHEMSRKIGVSVLDGSDIKRMAESEKVLFEDRIDEEKLEQKIKSVDSSRRGKHIQDAYRDLKASLIDDFGFGTVNRALDHFSQFSKMANQCHPNSSASEVFIRLSYISASIVAISIDLCMAKVSFKSFEERRKTLLNVIRFGHDDFEVGIEKIRVAAALVEKYIPNGSALSQVMISSVQKDYASIPAEIIVDFVLSHLKRDGLFQLARHLEYRGFHQNLSSFDNLSSDEKSFLGVVLDFSGSDRSSFAKSWTSEKAENHNEVNPEIGEIDSDKDVGPLFAKR
ncbi:hypothetical protein ABIE64_000571 [Thalassospira sp. MBR-102]|uniref:hypothetical protein n=1 Tax=Thalassospira sp. MBR-102 TaxID=3156466 RepID=UPI0033930D44